MGNRGRAGCFAGGGEVMDFAADRTAGRRVSREKVG